MTVKFPLMERTEVKTVIGAASHLFGLCWFDLHFVGLHLGHQVLPVLAYGALFGAHPGGIFAGFADGRNVAHALLRWSLHSFTCRTTHLWVGSHLFSQWIKDGGLLLLGRYFNP